MPNQALPRLSRRRFLTHAAKASSFGAAITLLPLGKCLAEDAEKPPRFKYSICNETFGNWPFEKAFAFAADCGYRGIEIAPYTINEYVTKISAGRRAEVCRLAQEAGLEVVGLHWLLAKTKGFHLTTADAAIRRKTAEYLGELARFLADLGGRIMVFGSPLQRNLAPGMSKEQGVNHAAEVLRAAMPACEKANVTIALEPLAPVDTNFMTTAADGARLVGLVGSPHCRLHLDCRAMATESTPDGEKGTGPICRDQPSVGARPPGASHKLDLSPFSQIPRLIHKYRKLFVHFHANDPNRQGPGFGKLDFVPIMKAWPTSTTAAGFPSRFSIILPARNGWRGKVSTTCKGVLHGSTRGNNNQPPAVAAGSANRSAIASRNPGTTSPPSSVSSSRMTEYSVGVV